MTSLARSPDADPWSPESGTAQGRCRIHDSDLRALRDLAQGAKLDAEDARRHALLAYEAVQQVAKDVSEVRAATRGVVDSVAEIYQYSQSLGRVVQGLQQSSYPPPGPGPMFGESPATAVLDRRALVDSRRRHRIAAYSAAAVAILAAITGLVQALGAFR